MTTAATASAHTELPSILHQRTLSNLSAAEDLFSSITGLDDLAGEDDLSFDDIEDSLDGGDRKSGGPAKKGKNRPASTAEKKATHNAVERARRESLNARFLVLADMLPGMTQVKRASKAAIVNKSIDLILELQKSESKLAKENEMLRAQLESLRNRSGSPSSTSSASAAAVNAAAAVVAAQEAAARQANLHQHAIFSGMQHPMQLPMHMMPHMPTAAAMASMAAAAAASGNPLMQQQVQQQQQQVASQMQNLAATAAPPTAEMGSHLFPGIFSGLFNNANGNGSNTFDAIDNARSESGSPSSAISHNSAGGNSASALFAHGLFDLPPTTAGMMNGSNKGGLSPGYNLSPPGTVASLAGSERTNQSNSAATTSSQLTHNGAPSPASSNGVPTPPSHSAAYSPLGLSAFAASTPQSQVSNSQQNQSNNGNTSNVTSAGNAIVDPVIAAFDGSADAAYLAAHTTPNDLVKAQNDLQAFMLHQHRMAFAPSAHQQPHTPILENGPHRHASVGSNGQTSPASSLFPPPTPGGTNNGGPAAFSFGQQANQLQNQQLNQQVNPYGASTNNIAGIAGMCGPSAQAGMTGMPAWQMMMAQHQAMVAAYGQQPHY